MALAWPIAVALLGDSAMGLVDTKLVSALGASAIGGVGIGTMVLYLNYAVVFGLMRGVKTRTAHAVGRGAPEDGTRYAAAGALLGLGLGLLVWAVGRDVTWVLVALRIKGGLIANARDFFAAVSWGAPGAFVMSALVQHRQAIGDARTPMVLGLAANVLNAVLAYVLIHGALGLPALGVRGAGYATATAVSAQAAVLLVLLARGKRRSTLPLGAALRHVVSLGGPTGLQFGVEMLAMVTLTAILGSLGEHEIAGHQIALSTIRASFLPGIAVGEAASVLVGQALGRKDLARADRVTRSALALAVAFMACCGVIFAAFGGVIARGFAGDGPVATVARHLLWVAALFQVLDAVNIVLRGALRGAKDVRTPALIGIAVVWIGVPGCAFLLGDLGGLGALGGWLGFVVETVLASGLYWWRWTRGAWRREYPPRADAGDGRAQNGPEAGLASATVRAS